MKKIILSLLGIVLMISVFAQNATTHLFQRKEIKKRLNRAACWQLKHPQNEYKFTDWTNGAFYAGLFAAYEASESKKLYKALYKMGESNKWQMGELLHHADDHALPQTYIDMYRICGEEKMIHPYKQAVDKFMSTHYSETPGLANAIERANGTLMFWCDALFMLPPALVKLGITLNEEKYLSLCDSLFKQTYELLYDHEEHLYARDISYKWDFPGVKPRKESNGEKVFWSRGNGWVMGGLARILKELPEDYPNRQFYVSNFKEIAERIRTLQQPDGLWRTSLLDPDSYPGGEASGSGFYCYALAWGINSGILEREEYLPVVRKAWIGLCALQQKNGKVGWVQPIGQDPKKNFSSESWSNFGTGAFLLAGSEMINL
ncbi:glycoside hydrolase family 88/105 protein [Sunxiuqinia rutila]|uniref:glycoside hydrolase family 88/105 protein n=1 Tax=Sunxiuqinia rutila TaxID=1397841 RepID=UPI003D369D55